jgi:D-arabinose 5-phosphate isomerase GutQ
MVGQLDSTLARYSDLVLDVSIKQEACPLGLAPTASTTAAMAMGMPWPWLFQKTRIQRRRFRQSASGRKTRKKVDARREPDAHGE